MSSLDFRLSVDSLNSNTDGERIPNATPGNGEESDWNPLSASFTSSSPDERSFDCKKRKNNCLCPLQAIETSYELQIQHMEEIFRSWNDSQKASALWKLMNEINSSEHKFGLFSRLEKSLKLDPLKILPGEICILILSFLSRRELARAAQVNTEWKALCYDKCLSLEKIQRGSIYCLHCTTFLAKETDILSQKYRLDYSLAFNIKTLCNVELCNTEKVEYTIGSFNIGKAHCCRCKSKLGIKYLEALDGKNEDKVGTFLLKKKALYFPGEPAHYVSLVCKGCNALIGKDQDIIDWNYVLRGGEAYLFSRLFNVYLGSPVGVTYTTGKYTVSDTFCNSCNENLGVKYIEAPNGKHAFKIGAYLIEKPKLKVQTYNNQPFTPKSKPKGFLSNLFSFLKK